MPKARDVQSMFDRIVGRYDLLNRVLSGGRDRAWRRELVRRVEETDPRIGLDLCCGTGDVALELLRGLPNLESLTAADFSSNMCAAAADKFADSGQDISMCCADGLRLPFADGSFDFVSVAFGVRNFEDLAAGLAEIARVLRIGGMAAILEFAPPRNAFLRALYKPYLRLVVPVAGRVLSGDSSAYDYLADSIQGFQSPAQMEEAMSRAGFASTRAQSLTFGVTYLYTAVR